MGHSILAKQSFWKNLIAGFSVSFLTLSMGAVFGILSSRGVFIGMLSAAIMALVTAFMSGTKVQATSPTGPLTATLIAIATQSGDPQTINFALLLAGAFLIIAGLLKIDRLIRFIPNIVISGFMTGIGILIAYKEIKLIFGLKGSEALAGPLDLNVLIVSVTIFLGFLIPYFLGKSKKYFVQVIPPTFLVLLISTAIIYLLDLNTLIETTTVSEIHFDLAKIKSYLSQQLPANYDLQLLLVALPIALEVAIISYLDTLMTALILEKKINEEADHRKDLYAQGAATVVVAAIGGVPGAQSTVPSIMLIKEGATKRIATIALGVSSFIGLFVFTDLIRLIPSAVFAGIIMKISYDVADILPFKLFFQGKIKLVQILFISIVALLTAFWSLNLAIVGATTLYIIQNRALKNPLIQDLKLEKESEGYSDEL